MSSRLLVLALALQPWRGAARHLRGRRRLDAADDVAVPPEIREALNDAVDAVVDDGGLYDDDVTEPPLTPAKEDVVEIPGEEEAEAHAHEYAADEEEGAAWRCDRDGCHEGAYGDEAVEEVDYVDDDEHKGDADEERAAWRCGSDGCHPVDRELRVEALREAFDEAGKKPFTKSADDPRDEDVAFFYAEEANHDQEEAIFQELYGTTTTMPVV
jgi:hypothetical protein